MPWGAIAGAAISTIGGLVASSRASRAARRQGQVADRQMQLATDQQNFSHGIYNDWKGTFFPLGQNIARDAQAQINPNYDQIAADVHGSYEAQRGAEQRRMERYGITPSDGASAERDLRMGNAEATTHVLARNTARRGAQQQRLQNMISAYGMASGMPGLASQTMAQSVQGLQGAGNIYGQQASNYGADANAAFGAAGRFLGGANWGNFGSGGYNVPGADATGPGSVYYSSSRELKTGIAPADTDDALDSVMRTPISKYRFKAGGPEMTGPIAEDAPANISTGKQVNLVSQVGTLTAAVQALAKHFGIDQSADRPASNMKRRVGIGPSQGASFGIQRLAAA